MKPTAPASQSTAAQGAGGEGHVDPAKLSKAVQNFGQLPPREQEEVIQQLTVGLSPRHAEAIRNYFKNLATGHKK
jgi:hypothetical protein